MITDDAQTYQAPPPFGLGLALGGTPFASAYADGVRDFLREALDAWNVARKKARSSGDVSISVIPPHAVEFIADSTPLKFAPRAGREADRALVAIDPSSASADLGDCQIRSDLAGIAKAAFAIEAPEARFQAEDLQLARDRFVFSRFVIAPAGGVVTSGALGALSELLPDDFRRHDFQLGRRNCQQFLRRHFVLPLANPLFRAWIKSHPRRKEIMQRYGVEQPTVASYPDEKQWCLSIIPLMDAVRDEIPLPPRPKLSPAGLKLVEKAMMERVGLSFHLGWWWKRRTTRKALEQAVRRGLERYDLI